MNQEWSQANRRMQTQLRKEATYQEGIHTLCELRSQWMDVLLAFEQELTREDFDAMPCLHANGYHNKNIAYSIWHIARIEDIVVHTLMLDQPQIFFFKSISETNECIYHYDWK